MDNESTRNQFYSLFLDRLRELYSGEQLLLDGLPMLIDSVSSNDLKLALEDNLDRNKEHLGKLKKEFTNLNESPKGLFSESMNSMIQECEYLKTKKLPDIVKEAALITSFQKILHYQIAGYGAVKTFAKHLDLKDFYLNLKTILDNKSSLDLKLTRIAEGSYFTKGINEKAAE